MNRRRTLTARQAPTQPAAAPAKPADRPGGSSWNLRELTDELVFVFVIVMFIKIFIVELYRIPTGSMTPTLLGGLVARADVNNDGAVDIVFWDNFQLRPDRPHIFLSSGDYRLLAVDQRHDPIWTQMWHDAGLISNIFDRILVNKFAYWMREPRRGDVVVFKVPEPIFTPEAPIYIKRLVGLPGERLTFPPDPASNGRLARLAVNGRPVEEPDFFRVWRYRPTITADTRIGYVDLAYAQYEDLPNNERRIVRVDVPHDQVFVLGDNTEGSLDSRYWGGVPLNNLKGQAFMRVWPLSRIGYIH